MFSWKTEDPFRQILKPADFCTVLFIKISHNLLNIDCFGIILSKKLRNQIQFTQTIMHTETGLQQLQPQNLLTKSYKEKHQDYFWINLSDSNHSHNQH